jgi:peptidoglycan/LPS O-acetylase OafA/YrhL
LAVFLVLGRHLQPCPADVNPILGRIAAVWTRGGWVGVDLFFVLSGFLVSGLLFREYEKYRELHIGRFLIRRGFKIYPPFWLLIGVTVLLAAASTRTPPLGAIASELLFVQNYRPALWDHTWSLAVEEHFYFLLAFVLFLFARRETSEPFRFIPAAFVIIALLCLALRIHVGHSAPYKHKTHLFPTHLRLDGLCFGVLLSYSFHRHPVAFLGTARRFKYVFASIGVLMLLPAFYYPLETTSFISTFGLTLFYLGSGSLLIAALGTESPRTSFGSALAYAGSHSYSVYLWHMSVALWGTLIVSHLLSGNYNWHVYTLVYLIGAIGFGIGMAVITEFPVLRIRDRVFPSRGAPLSSKKTGPNNAMQLTAHQGGNSVDSGRLEAPNEI